MFSILILGAYGNFGRRLCERLAREPELRLVLAGRDRVKAEQLREALRAMPARCEAQALDWQAADFPERLNRLSVQLVIHAGGPFQGQDYRVARCCLELGVHYLDLADGRDYVAGITALDALARAKGVLLVSGASSVPGLSSAVVDSLLPRFVRLDSIETAIAPGNRSERGEATIAAILSYVGRPYRVFEQGRWQERHGWQGLRRIQFPPPVGARWLARCEVPDLQLFPARYAGVRRVAFYAGLELAWLHLGLYAFSWLSRWRLVDNWRAYLTPLITVSRWFEGWGSDKGGMSVRLTGLGQDGQALALDWQLTVGSGHGPAIPGMVAVLLAKRLARGELRTRGALPCLGLFSREQFMKEVSDLDIAERIVESDK